MKRMADSANTDKQDILYPTCEDNYRILNGNKEVQNYTVKIFPYISTLQFTN